ncbi:MAG: prepilin-type N-terminal cleavage/methylation domain-containing protein [Phycisphaeraceae bacterium]|nr:prepilin-type N-terminal cleavage/methylation domain-containing protein [Phycisphaeraceae bacterium]
MHTSNMSKKRGGFSLIELVIVVVIIGIIGAIAIPRLSRGAEGASDSALAGDLAVMRNAIDLYATEHGGTYPTVAAFEAQLTTYTDANGNTNATKTGSFIYGPYIRKIPAVKVGDEKGSTTVAAAAAIGVGWVYDASAGTVVPNTGTDTDAGGKAYTDY